MSLTLRTETTDPTVADATAEPDSRQREPLHPVRLGRAKKAYTTRFLAADLQSSAEGYTLCCGAGVIPVSGDVVLARIEQIGLHARLESPVSRRQPCGSRAGRHGMCS